MVGTVNVATARSNLSELMNRVAYGNEVIVIESRGKPKAALVGVDSIAETWSGIRPIMTTPEVRSGKPCIVGRRITVSDVVIWHEQMGMTPGQVADDYDLTLAQVYAALSYYHAHRDEISSEIEESLRFAESFQNIASSPLDRKQQADRG